MRKEANHRYFSFQIISGVTLLLCPNFLHMSLATSLVRSTMARQRPIIIAASTRAKQSPVHRGRISCLHLLVSSWVLTLKNQNKINKQHIIDFSFVYFCLLSLTTCHRWLNDNLERMYEEADWCRVWAKRKRKRKLLLHMMKKNSSHKNIKRKER